MSFLKVFQKEYEKFLKIDRKFNPQISPLTLIKELQGKKSERKECVKMMKKKTNNGFKIMRRQSLIHMLLMYSNNLSGIGEDFLNDSLSSSNEWLNENIILPYYLFLKKVVASHELYTSVKASGKGQFNFEKIFYLYQLFIELFKVVKKMPLLGRYYKDKYNILTSTFIQVIAVQAQKFYNYLKNSLQECLTNSKRYLMSRQDEQLLKVILEECLIFINEEMKKLLLDKYFYPYGKGITIKLFKTQEQSQYVCKIINGIVNDHKDTQRQQAQQTLQKTLFPENGQVDLQFYERTLIPTTINNRKQELFAEEDEDINFQSLVEKLTQKETSDNLQKSEDV